MWIAHMTIAQVGPDPQDVKIIPGSNATFHTAGEGGAGLVATRFWPKMGCDDAGSHCEIGESGGPGEECVIRLPGKPDDYSQCSPPFDTKFEATLAPPDAPARDTIDMSLVDGYTLPFKLEVSGGSCVLANSQKPFASMDCSRLSLNQCPRAESMNGQAVDLRAFNPKTGKLSGCYAPCQKLIDDKWNKGGFFSPDSPQAGPYCCGGASASPDVCSAGPIVQSQYMKAKNEVCPLAYGYPFDDKVATIVCSTSTRYTLTFYCPSAGADAASRVVYL